MSAPSRKRPPSKPDLFGGDSKIHANVDSRTDLSGNAGSTHAAGGSPQAGRSGSRRRVGSRQPFQYHVAGPGRPDPLRSVAEGPDGRQSEYSRHGGARLSVR